MCVWRVRTWVCLVGEDMGVCLVGEDMGVCLVGEDMGVCLVGEDMGVCLVGEDMGVSCVYVCGGACVFGGCRRVCHVCVVGMCSVGADMGIMCVWLVCVWWVWTWVCHVGMFRVYKQEHVIIYLPSLHIRKRFLTSFNNALILETHQRTEREREMKRQKGLSVIIPYHMDMW